MNKLKFTINYKLYNKSNVRFLKTLKNVRSLLSSTIHLFIVKSSTLYFIAKNVALLRLSVQSCQCDIVISLFWRIQLRYSKRHSLSDKIDYLYKLIQTVSTLIYCILSLEIFQHSYICENL